MKSGYVAGMIVPQPVSNVIEFYLRSIDARGVISGKELKELTSIVNEGLTRLHLVPNGEKGVAQRVTNSYLKRINYKLLEFADEIIRVDDEPIERKFSIM